MCLSSCGVLSLRRVCSSLSRVFPTAMSCLSPNSCLLSPTQFYYSYRCVFPSIASYLRSNCFVLSRTQVFPTIVHYLRPNCCVLSPLELLHLAFAPTFVRCIKYGCVPLTHVCFQLLCLVYASIVVCCFLSNCRVMFLTRVCSSWDDRCGQTLTVRSSSPTVRPNSHSHTV